MTKTLAVLSAVIAAALIATGSASGGAASASGEGMSTAKVVIRHVERGCHVWSQGKVRTTSLQVHLMRGARLQIVNRDIEPHELVQLGGPNLRLQGHLMPGNSQVLTFAERGMYRFKTKVVQMGPVMNVETIGPDNTLRLKVAVH